MVDWRGSKYVTGKTSPAAAAALPLMEEKKAKEDQGLYRGRGKLAGYGMYPKRVGENFAGGRSRPSLDKNLEGVAEG